MARVPTYGVAEKLPLTESVMACSTDAPISFMTEVSTIEE